MILQVLSVRDRAAEHFHRPDFAQTTGLYLRQIADEVNRQDAQNMLFRHARDFDVYHLGTWNDADGAYSAFSAPVLLVNCQTLKVLAEGQAASGASGSSGGYPDLNALQSHG